MQIVVKGPTDLGGEAAQLHQDKPRGEVLVLP
jgi:hypothetical protein